ncbi:MAG: ATP-binding cassette domain-containing protein [Ideonella sp.]|nr:ATP-binding cassette domain-containing protein [Ideonella sp.]
MTAESLHWFPGGPTLSFRLMPGLHGVCGGEQRGKSSLLRVLAGQHPALSGQLTWSASTTCWWMHTDDPALDPVTAQDWLCAQQKRLPRWQTALATDLAEALGLQEHLHKPFYMLSAGSRRKVGLLGAAASGADLILLDGPYAALDQRSCRVVDELLSEAANSDCQAWVLADYALPPGLARARWATVVDLGE